MSKRPPTGHQADTIDRNSPFTQLSFDLNKQDKFVTSFAVDFVHYKAMPSPLGLKDRGDYRRSDGVDVITSNGMIYHCAGKFSATMVDNERSQKGSAGGILDPSQSRLILPRFYNKNGLADGERIYIAPGDRLYIADPDADVKVSNYQQMDYIQGDNIPMFPIVSLEAPIIDSRNATYTQGVDFTVTSDGNIRWLPGGKNPGIDPETGKGRVYSIRYLYKAYWYVVSLPKEVRVTNVTTGKQRTPERMPYHAVVVREYIYHNQNKGDQTNQLKSKDPKRESAAPVTSATPNKYAIPVDMSAIGDDGEQS
jgi:hypothetical protein